MKRLEGKVALVTGASRGIGRAIAERFAAEGARLVLGCAREASAMEDVRQACETAGCEAITVQGDLAQPKTALGLCEVAMDRFGRLDVLVNNAAVVAEDLLPMLSDARLLEMVAVNISGLTMLTRAALRPMLRQRSGAIVNLSSAAAQHPGRGNSVYAGTKGYVEAFTRALAAEVGRKGIRVNAVAPGIVRSRMTEPLRTAMGEDALERHVALRRLGEPGDVANVVAFLSCNESAYVNGAVVAVDGGLFFPE